MDAASLRRALANLRGAVERIPRIDHDRASRLSSGLEELRHEIAALDGRLHRVEQCLAATSAQGLARLTPGLGQVGYTVSVALEKAQRDVAFTTAEPGQRADDLRRSATDLRQCVLLLDFASKVLALYVPTFPPQPCHGASHQLIAHSPADSQAQREAEDLRGGARLLYAVQGRSGEERLGFLRERLSSISYSSGLRAFLEGLLEAEDDCTSATAYGSFSGLAQPSSRSRRTGDRDELHLPTEPSQCQQRSGEARPSNAEIRTRSRQVSYPSTPREVEAVRGSPLPGEKSPPPLPPKESASTDADEAASTTKLRIARRPVARSSTTPIPSTASSIPSQPPPADLDRSASRTMPTRLKLRPGRRTATRELFSQASRSLSNLTQGFECVDSPNDADMPPPYDETPPSVPPPQDGKRRHADSVSSALSQDQSTFALIQDNLHDRLRERVKQGAGINEVDPLTKRTALMEAAHLERADMVGVMLKVSNQVHQKDVEGNSALHYAAIQGNAAICQALLDYDAAVEDYNRNGETPISLAARGGYTDAVDCLLNGWTIQRGTAAALTKGYLESLKSGNVNTVATFIERHIKPKKIKESVLCAAEGGSVPTLDYVLAQKCNLKQKSPDGWTALHFAAEKGHIAMVEKLLALGLSWKAQTKKVGETALAIAIRSRQVATANTLILHKDAKVNREDNDRVSPLHHAARIGELGLMTTLLNAGARLDVQSKYGWTVMHTAVAYGHTHLVAELITRGVSIEEKLTEAEVYHTEKTNEGARRGYWAEIRWPHTNARSLHLALEFGHDDVANLLIAAGAKIDAADGKNWRPLHYAAFAARPALVELLLAKGASPHATTDDNNTPLGLGFRAHGLNAGEEEKVRVWELLQGAMNATKKSRLRQFADFMAGSSAGRQVDKRNRIWHTAELAALLHYEEPAVEGASEDGSERTLSTNEKPRGDVHGEELEQVRSRTSFASDVKSPPR